MGGWGVEYCFGHYIPFLGAFFGVNVLFGAWDGVYGKLYAMSFDEAERIRKEWENDTTTLDTPVPDTENNALRKRRNRNTQNREWIKAGGRFAGLATAAAIAAAFFFVPKDTPLPWWTNFIMAFPVFFPVSAVLLMWFNSRGLKEVRNQENEILRRVGQTNTTIDAVADDRIIDTVAEKITSPQQSDKI